MKRSNGFLIGTILVVLVALMVFLQSQAPDSAKEDEHEHADAPAATKPADGTPTIEDLQNQVRGSTGAAPRTTQPGVPAPAGPIAPSDTDTGARPRPIR